MDPSLARHLSNDFQSVHLLSLRRWPDAAWYAPPESGGPYVIMQTAIDPDDPGADVDEFVLARDGRWRPLSMFFRVRWTLRGRWFLFPTAADAIAAMQGLVGRPVIDRQELVDADADAASETSGPAQDTDRTAFRAALEPVSPQA